ncbi:MAG: ATP-dependent zinc metalloprotease FtsH [Proteobacteria bacterium]|nr:ATP-dependent zinc metalloprotease FtsH [Pseudomonadota bacterium]MBU1641031.1 ATP-dependent zinc metalloprotease FtsH [Pseudomonadota bacterium]
MNLFYKNLTIWLIIGLTAILVLNLFKGQPQTVNVLTYSDFVDKVKNGVVTNFSLNKNIASWQDSNGERFRSVVPENPSSVQSFIDAGAKIEIIPSREPHWFFRILLSWSPILILAAIWFFFMRKGSNQGGGKAMAFGKSKAQLIDAQQSTVRFKDVAGIDEAKEELVEIVDFLKDPTKFTEAGARIPTGVLLYGEPGTGKTLLAKAIAGEAGVSFFSISGSNFVEMYVGIGASRVRDLFAEGKKKAPCIIFIDEIDAVGRHRSSGAAGGNDEREQTLNQLLVEMDGFEVNDKVIIVAATNRLDILDQALLRPGRFDRQVLVPLPDVLGREQILKVHAQKIKASTDIDWKTVAKSTPGFSGAELANMINEAALMVARRGGMVTMRDLESAKDKVMMGAERRSMIITEEEKKITAYHEVGHALVAWMLPGADPVHKVTIVPRGKALGLTMQLPETEKHSHSYTYLFNNLCILLGGRIAEELVFDEITTGSGNDIERVSDLARKMVCEWGMSKNIGPIVFKASEQPGASNPLISAETIEKINSEIRELVETAHDTARKILTDNEEIMKAITLELLEKETISHKDIQNVFDQHKA